MKVSQFSFRNLGFNNLNMTLLLLVSFSWF